MKKTLLTNVCSFMCGAVMFGAIGAFAATYTATPNTYPVQLNGQSVQLEGYNIEGSTYFKLRDIGDKMGFDVNFKDNTIVVNAKVAIPDTTPTPQTNKLSETEYQTKKTALDNELKQAISDVDKEVDQKTSYWETEKKKYSTKSLEKKLSDLESQREQFEGAVTSAGKSKYNSICEQIELVEQQIAVIEANLEQIDDTIESLEEQGQTAKENAQKSHDEELTKLNNMK